MMLQVQTSIDRSLLDARWRSSFGRTGEPHRFEDALPIGTHVRADCGCRTLAADRKIRVDGKSGLYSGLRLFQRAEQSQGSGKIEVCSGIIAIGLDAVAQPRDGFRIGT